MHISTGVIVAMMDRNAFPKTGRTFPLRAGNRKRDYAGTIALALQSELGSSHQAVKTLMRWTNANERTAKNWLGGAHGPSGEHLISLVMNSDQVFDAVLILAGRRTILPHARLASLRDALQATAQRLAEVLDEEATQSCEAEPIEATRYAARVCP